MVIGRWRQRIAPEGRLTALQWARVLFIVILVSVGSLIWASWSLVLVVRRTERATEEMLETTRQLQRDFNMAQMTAQMLLASTQKSAKYSADVLRIAMKGQGRQQKIVTTLVDAAKRTAVIERRQLITLRRLERLLWLEYEDRWREGRQDNELRQLERRRRR